MGAGIYDDRVFVEWKEISILSIAEYISQDRNAAPVTGIREVEAAVLQRASNSDFPKPTRRLIRRIRLVAIPVILPCVVF